MFGNLKLLGVIAVSVVLQFGLHHLGFSQELLGLGPLSLTECGVTLLLGLVPVTVLELAKLVRGGSPRLDALATPPLVKEPSPRSTQSLPT